MPGNVFLAKFWVLPRPLLVFCFPALEHFFFGGESGARAGQVSPSFLWRPRVDTNHGQQTTNGHQRHGRQSGNTRRLSREIRRKWESEMKKQRERDGESPPLCVPRKYIVAVIKAQWADKGKSTESWKVIKVKANTIGMSTSEAVTLRQGIFNFQLAGHFDELPFKLIDEQKNELPA